jgi:ketosteroid isomerase-like protein
VNLDDVERWMDGYVKAWTTNDRADIEALFTPDATYATAPYREPTSGRDAIVAEWLENRDEPDGWQFRYEPLALAGDLAFVRGWTRYTDATPRIYHNLWIFRLAEDGRASEFTEWFMKERTAQA